jgi:hypothetical protein
MRSSRQALDFAGQTLDFAVAIALLLVALAYAHNLAFDRPPFEDAAMIMRYAEHLAAGQGIVWNIGQHPVDGATDFLFLVVIAGLNALGAPIELAVRGVTLTAHLATVLLVYLANRRLWNAPVAIAAFLAWYLAAGTGLTYVKTFFGTPFFVFAACATWAIGLKIIRDGAATPRLAISFAALALTTGLIRPDGVILVMLMALALPIAIGWRRSADVLLIFAVIMLFLGGGYFLWHWRYFGYPLPNPYYKKGGGELHWNSLGSSLLDMARFSWPMWPAFALGLRTWYGTRRLIAVLLPPIAFASAFILISDEMNFGGRFQYVTLPLILMAWLAPIGDLVRALEGLWSARTRLPERLAWVLASAMAAFMMVRYSAAQRCVFGAAPEVCYSEGGAAPSEPRASGFDTLFDIANILGKYREKEYVLATTEAGLLPYYSRWNSLDMWGLNDQWIAHNHGIVTEEYLDRWHPHVVVSHAYFAVGTDPSGNSQFAADPWNRMTITVKHYVDERGYRLAAAFGASSTNLYYYYVRSDFTDSEAIAHDIAIQAARPGAPHNYALQAMSSAPTR